MLVQSTLLTPGKPVTAAGPCGFSPISASYEIDLLLLIILSPIKNVKTLAKKFPKKLL